MIYLKKMVFDLPHEKSRTLTSAIKLQSQMSPSLFATDVNVR